MMESFFSILQTEMLYGYEKTLKSLGQLERAITNYIFYYNHKRIKKNQKDLALYNTELNPLFKIICLTFWGQYNFPKLLVNGYIHLEYAADGKP